MFSNDGKSRLGCEDEIAVQELYDGLLADSDESEPDIEANLVECARMASFYGQRMKMVSSEAFQTLAALCLVLGKDRDQFFGSVFLNQMMLSEDLTPEEKLNRIVRVVIDTIPRCSATEQS